MSRKKSKNTPPIEVWKVEAQRGFYCLVRNGDGPFDRSGFAALNFDDQQAALDMAEALNMAHRRRTSQ